MSPAKPAPRAPDSGRIARRFAALKSCGRAGLVAFVVAGDPDYETSLALIKGTEKEKDWKVSVTGTVDGQTLTVSTPLANALANCARLRGAGPLWTAPAVL